MIQACHRPIPNCHWLRPRKSWMYKLSSICNHAAKYEVAPMVTFDQPQSWKAFIIMYNEQQGSQLHSIIFRLGGFPTWMTFVVSIDHGVLWYRVHVVKDICRLNSQSHGLWWGIWESHWRSSARDLHDVNYCSYVLSHWSLIVRYIWHGDNCTLLGRTRNVCQHRCYSQVSMKI